MRILLVSSLYPGPDDPDYGTFVRSIAGELEAQGHEVVRVVTDRRAGGLGKQIGFALRAAWAAIRHRPDVVYAHYLVPAGAIAAVASRLARAPLVVTAHGRDVRNIGELRGVERLTRMAVAPCVGDRRRLGLPARRAAEEDPRGGRADRGHLRRRRPRAVRPARCRRGSPRARLAGRGAVTSSASARSTSARTSCGWPRRSRGSAAGRSRSSATARARARWQGSRACA